MSCVFCKLDRPIVSTNELAYAIRYDFPVLPRHTLVIREANRSSGCFFAERTGATDPQQSAGRGATGHLNLPFWSESRQARACAATVRPETSSPSPNSYFPVVDAVRDGSAGTA